MPRNPFTRVSVAFLAVTLTLTGCTTKWDEPLDPIIWSIDVTQTPSPTPTAPPAPPVAGDVVDKETAIKLRKDMTDDFHAYEMADGTWVVINLTEPLPESVLADATVKAGSDREIGAYGEPLGVYKQLGVLKYELGRGAYAALLANGGCNNSSGNVVSWHVISHNWHHLTCATRDQAIAFGEQLAAAENALFVVLD